MAAMNLLKPSGLLLSLSLYTRTPRTPLSLLPLKSPLLSLSSFSLLHSTPLNAVPAIKTHCTAADAAISSSSAPASPLSSSSNETASLNEKDAVKEAAKLLEIRVGRIVKAWRHPDAESLYVEEVDVGENEARLICSGLVNFVPLDHLQNKLVVVLANLKPRNMRGVKSSGMLMAASDASHENIELLVPPEGSSPGERIWFGLEDEKENQPAAATPNQIQKKKIWETVQPHLKTDDSCVAMLGLHVMRTSAGPVMSSSLKNANIS